MEINGKKVNGIFIYNSNSSYDQGDIVLKGTTMYIANSPVSGVDPETSPKFNIYLGDKYASYTDYLNYTSTENPTDDKYISVKTLPAILNHYLTGINIKGVIQDVGDEDKILDKLISDPEINFGVYSVTRSLSDIDDIYSGKLSIQQPDKLILKQYTYTYKDKGADGKIEKEHTVRVQELIDHSQYMVWYRKMELGNQASLSEWGNVSINMEHLNNRIKQLQKEYNDRMDALRQVMIELKGNFRYRNLPVTTPSNKYTVSSEYKDYVISFGIRITKSGFTERADITLDMSTSISKFKTGDVYVKLENSGVSGSKIISLYSNSSYTTLHTSAVIDTVTLHQYYE